MSITTPLRLILPPDDASDAATDAGYANSDSRRARRTGPIYWRFLGSVAASMGPDNCVDAGRSVCHDAFQESPSLLSSFQSQVARRSWFFLGRGSSKRIDERMNQWWLPGHVLLLRRRFINLELTRLSSGDYSIASISSLHLSPFSSSLLLHYTIALFLFCLFTSQIYKGHSLHPSPDPDPDLSFHILLHCLCISSPVYPIELDHTSTITSSRCLNQVFSVSRPTSSHHTPPTPTTPTHQSSMAQKKSPPTSTSTST